MHDNRGDSTYRPTIMYIVYFIYGKIYAKSEFMYAYILRYVTPYHAVFW